MKSVDFEIADNVIRLSHDTFNLKYVFLQCGVLYNHTRWSFVTVRCTGTCMQRYIIIVDGFLFITVRYTGRCLWIFVTSFSRKYWVSRFWWSRIVSGLAHSQKAANAFYLDDCFVSNYTQISTFATTISTHSCKNLLITFIKQVGVP